MKKRKYFLAFDGEKLAANMDGDKDNKKLRGLVNVFYSMGLTVKQVTKEEYEQAILDHENKELDSILGNKR